MKSQNFKWIWVFAFIIVSVSLITLITLYLKSPNVVTSGDKKWGGPAEFGQFGDMIGGVLNPIFGLLTVFLLLQTYKITHSDSLKVSRKSARDETKLMIKEFSELLDRRKNEPVFALTATNVRIKLTTACNSMFDIHPKEMNDLLQTIINEQNLDLDDINHRKNKAELRAMIDMRSTILHIIDLYISLIDYEENDTINTFTFIQLDDFLYTQKNHYLITQTEYSMYIVRASEKYGKLPQGFTPKYETGNHVSFVSVGMPTIQEKVFVTQIPPENSQ